MLRNKETSTRRRSQPRPGLEPIHLDELLGGAGMSGFLAVLEPPPVAPHLSDACADLALAGLCEQGRQLAVWFAGGRLGAATGTASRNRRGGAPHVGFGRATGAPDEQIWTTKRRERQWQIRQHTEIASGRTPVRTRAGKNGSPRTRRPHRQVATDTPGFPNWRISSGSSAVVRTVLRRRIGSGPRRF